MEEHVLKNFIKPLRTNVAYTKKLVNSALQVIGPMRNIGKIGP